MFRKKINYLGRKLTWGILTCLLFITTVSCQRDDICPESTETTPLLRISFFDMEETDIPKPPVNLTVKAADIDSILFNRVNVTEISIPLKPNVGITSYEFTINAPADPDNETENNGNTDLLTFTYTPEQVYINRACSYKVNYLNLTAVQGQEDDNMWISSIIVQQPNIENETEPHIFIFH